jgi:hypothetical protein
MVAAMAAMRSQRMPAAQQMQGLPRQGWTTLMW